MKTSNKRAFTIVELIVVIAVIGILAGIASVSYGAWRIRAASDVLKSDLTQSASQLKSELNWKGQYPSSQAAVNNNKGLPKSPDTTYQYTGVPIDKYYCLTAVSNIAGVPAFMVSSDNTTPREGVCDTHEGPSLPGVDAMVWRSYDMATTNNWDSLAYGNSSFVGLGTASSGAQATINVQVAPSNGESWTQGGDPSPVPRSTIWRVVYAKNRFVAVGGASAAYATVSQDGTTWTPAANTGIGSGSATWVALTYGNGRFVAIANTTMFGVAVMSSTDGSNWTQIGSLPSGSTWTSIAYGNGRFIAVARTGDTRVAVSANDGQSWTYPAISEVSAWTSIAYGNGGFVAVANSGTRRAIVSGDDGTSWTAYNTNPAAIAWREVAYGNGRFVAVGSNRISVSSSGGQTWLSPTNTSADQLRSVTYGNGRFVIVGTNKSMVSP